MSCPCCGGTGTIEGAEVMFSDDTAKRMAAALREKGVTIRGIAKLMGYSHPGSVSHLLKKHKVGSLADK